MFLTMSDGCRIFADSVGSALRAGGREAEPIVFVHGGPGGRHNGMRKSFSALANDYQLFFYDQRGMGRSDRSEKSAWNIERWSKDLAELIDQLGLQGCTIVAQSFGVYVGVQALARRPELAQRLIVGGAKIGISLERVVAAFAERGGDNAASIADLFWRGSSDPAVIHAYEQICFPLYQYKNPLTNPKIDCELQQHWLHNGLSELDLQPGSIRCPVQILSGLYDPISTPADSKEFAAALISSEHVDFQTFPAGHAVYLDQQRETLSAIRRFLGEPRPNH